MDLDFSEEQDVLREMVHALCQEHCGIDVVREMEDDAQGYPNELWKQLAEVGLLGLLIPEAYGGAGQGWLDAAIVYEEFGRALAPTPAFVSSVVAANSLLTAASETQKEAWLPRIASGEAIVSVAWLEPGGTFSSKGIRTQAELSVGGSGGWLISGHKRGVPFASAATQLIVPARTGPGEDDISLFLVDPAEGATLTQRKTMAGDAQFDVVFEDARGELIGELNDGWAIWDRVLLDAIILLAATAIGGADRALEITNQYAKDRKQFDKPIGAFQSLAHYLADALTKIDGGRVLVYEAAWLRDQERDTARVAPMAKLFACDTFRETTAKCQQIWGGVGFSVEYDIQLYFRRAKQLQLSWWDSATLEERIAADVLDR